MEQNVKTGRRQAVSKTYVDPNLNRCDKTCIKRIRIDDLVIVTNTDFMVDATHHKPVPLRYFKSGPKVEVFVVKSINKPSFTDYTESETHLGIHNNCVLLGGDGQEYYCSLRNVVRYVA